MPIVNREQLIDRIKSGEVGSFPTDTLPALAVLPVLGGAIYTLKERSPTKPLIIMAADIEDLWMYVRPTGQERVIWQQIATKYLPGGLTLVLPASELVPAAIDPTASNTIGIRVPKHDLARSILAETGPLATTSANKSGRSPLLTMTEIAREFPQVNTLEIEPDLPARNTPSTVIKWTGNNWDILRQGAIEFSTSPIC
jgi:L-threonylcarbamoyladenylate synthase